LDVNRASKELLLRVPGFGVKTVGRILSTRRHRRLRYEDITRMGASMKKARAFVTAEGWSPRGLTDSADLRARFAPPPEQLTLF
jgi:predicted DNA-binding helix-hairpin-helix protein